MTNKVTYYREVKASERLPKIEDSYIIIINGVKSAAEFHLYDNPQPHLHIKPNMWTKDDRHGYEYEVCPGSWLEPIEITGIEESFYKHGLSIPNHPEERTFTLAEFKEAVLTSKGIETTEEEIDKEFIVWELKEEAPIPDPNNPDNREFYLRLEAWRECANWLLSKLKGDGL